MYKANSPGPSHPTIGWLAEVVFAQLVTWRGTVRGPTRGHQHLLCQVGCPNMLNSSTSNITGGIVY